MEGWKDVNTNMEQEYISSWIVCVDESMVVFHNPYAPGWITIDRKPHPFGNEYHTTADAETGILFFIEIVEGNDRPKTGPHSIVPLLNETKQKTAALVLRMTKPLWGSGRVVVLDSGFGGIPTISNLARKGLYGTCVIKKNDTGQLKWRHLRQLMTYTGDQSVQYELEKVLLRELTSISVPSALPDGWS